VSGAAACELRLGGFADEAADGIKRQIEATRALGWSTIEARAVDGVNIHDLDEAAFERCAAALEASGIGVSCFGSTIANWGRDVGEDFGAALKTVDRAVRRMKRLGARMVRVMSYAILSDASGRAFADQREAERFARLREICGRFLAAGITPVHENCLNYGGMSWEHTLRLLEEVPGLKLVYDTGNPGLTPDFRKPFPYPNQDSWEAWSHLKPFVAHIHLKDGSRDPATGEERYFFPGEGECQVERVLADLLDSGYRGDLSIEPHMKVVFHDASVRAADRARFDNYVEYGRRTEALLRGFGCAVGQGVARRTALHGGRGPAL
jgi:sugar phosphate isomerase/epimerase